MPERRLPQPILDLCIRYSNPAERGGKEIILGEQMPDEASLVGLKNALSHLAASLGLPLSTVYPALQRYISESIIAQNRFIKRKAVVNALFDGSHELVEIIQFKEHFSSLLPAE